MEPDLPLIQIPGEEDDTSASSSPFFSPIARSNDKGDAAKYNASGFSNGNKENINVNNSELTKLSVEPQQMKRKKKGAYNFRKSLAWDKAFSTDEGFLDPSELSMLGGSNDNSCRDFLPSIGEDGGKLSGNSYNTDDSSNLQGTPKIMSNKKCGNSGSKSCCPRPLVFSSLKRPANASILKAAAKESKLPKLPVLNSGAHSLLKISKSNLSSTSQNCGTTNNQIRREDIQKVARPQSTLKIIRTSTSKRKSESDSLSVSEKSPTQQSRRNKDIPGRRLSSTSDLQPRRSSLAARVNSGHKAPSAALPPSGSYTVVSHGVVRREKIVSEKVSVAATTSQVQSRKSSGLRMPSPSLGFFSQPKSSGSNSSIEKATHPINITGCNVPKSRKLNVLNCTYDSRLPHVPLKLQRKVANNSSNSSSDVSRSSSEFVSSSDYNNTHKNVNVKLAKKSVFVKEHEISLHAKSAEVTKENQAVQRTSDCHMEIQEGENSCKVDQNSLLQQIDIQKNYNHCFIVDKFSDDQLKKDDTNVIVDSTELRSSENTHLENTDFVSQISLQVSDQDVHETTDTVYHQHVKDNHSSSSTIFHGTISESQSGDSSGDFEQDSVTMTRNDDSKAKLDVDQWKTEKAKSPTRFSGEDGDVIMMTLPVRIDDIFLEDKSFKPPTNKRENSVNGSSRLCESKRSEILCSNAPPLKGAEQANQDDSGFDQVLDEYSVADDSDGSLLFNGADAEKCEQIHCLETRVSVFSELNHSDIVTEKQGVNQVAAAVLTDSFENPPVDASVSNAKEMFGSVQDDCCHINSQARPGRSLETSRDHESTELFYAMKEEIVGGGAKDMGNQLQPEVAEVYSNKCYLENEKTWVEDSQSLHQSHSGEPERTCYNSTDQVSSGSFQISCLPLSTMQVDKSEKDNATNGLYIGDTEVQNGRNSKQINLGADNLVSEEVCTDTNVESGQPLEIHFPSLVVDHFCNENHDIPLNDCTLVGEVTSGEGNCLSTALTDQGQTYMNQVQLSMGGSGVFVEGVNEKQSLDCELSGSIDTETLDEHDINSLDTDCKSDVILSGQATYIESCVASIAMGAQTFGLTSICGQSQSNAVTGFIDQKIRAPADSLIAVDTGVNKINSTSPADIDLNVTHGNESLITDYQHDQDNTSCLIEDANATFFTKRSGDGEAIGNLAIKPPIHAIPFSDEWLAAMEAAGEEILTMKRGAVQNSPTEKELPEPSPWSPVKKKQNQIGPYDCTKFINVPHSSD